MKKVIILLMALSLCSVIFGQRESATGIKCDGMAGQAEMGVFETFYSDGQLKSTYLTADGLAHGEAKFFGPDGNIEEVGRFERGNKHGLWESFSNLAVKTGEAYYHMGAKDGVWTVWDDSGTKRYHMVYSMNQKVDVWKMWDENSNLVSEKIH